MSDRFEVPTRTREQQERVSDPAVSAWVSANAGAGKTTVLVRRVIRLLLDGNSPARILCLTFTKAAAANMANKVLETLSNWVRLDDASLDAAMREISPLVPSSELRARARRLFAQALETPGGLKVQTIHAFCDRVLHQFPFEAGVQAGFEVLDEVAEADLLARARRSAMIEAANDPSGELGRALAYAVAVASDVSLEEALAEAVAKRRKVERLVDADVNAVLAAALGLRIEQTVEAVETEIVSSPHLPPKEWPALAEILRTGGKTERDFAERLLEAGATRAEDRCKAYLKAFLTQAGTLRNRIYTKGFGEAHPDLAVRLDREFDRVSMLIDGHCAARARERTSALLALAAATIREYERNKRARGALDYADLIAKTADLFNDTGSAWVLFKLDGGIDHVLIDEAQDTSPEQWNVVARLTAEFFAGGGARENRKRTIFAVGDEKQSIFSFQGADPREFERMRREFERRVTSSASPFEYERLDLSFRSVPGVLGAVDTVFGRAQAFRGLSSGDETKIVHTAIRSRAPALVEIWPTEKPDEDLDEEPAWTAPLDARRESSPIERLAQRIAVAVRHWLGELAVGDGDKRHVLRPGDIIVLVRQRGPLFHAILQALKRRGIPVAGADRLTLNEHIAVMDLMALGDALTLEHDDLALACVLKSPLFGLDEDDLFTLAHGRAGTLTAALLASAKANPKFGAAAEKFRRWRGEAGELRPFDFYSRVLGRDRGREQILARLGIEAADALDEFLSRALAYEQIETPSLVGFLSFLRRAGTEVKRDLEVESNAVRVMTVHGAKGLEAPLVILADTTATPDGRDDDWLLDLPGTEAFVWAGKKESDSARMQEAREAAAELREAEYRRLLYVALTRAADALVVCGAEGQNKLKDGCWYRLVHDALEATGTGEFVEVEVPYAVEKIRRWRPQDMDGHAAPVAAAREAPLLPPWLALKPTPAPRPSKRIVPLPFDPDTERVSPLAATARALDARRRGDLVHRLLQRLPELSAADREGGAARLLAAIAGDVGEPIRAQLTAEVLAVIGHPALAELFGPGSRAEVDLIAAIPGVEQRRVDRIAVTKDMVLIADFKTGSPPADAGLVPENYLQQLAIYREAIGRIYPDRAMRVLLVWTDGPAIREIPAAGLDTAWALAQAQITAP